MHCTQKIIASLVLFGFSLCGLADDLVTTCEKAAPQLACDTLSQKDLQSLDRMCSDATKTLQPWSGYGVGASEILDKSGALNLVLNKAKQGSANGRTSCTEYQAYRYPQTEYDIITAIFEAKSKGYKIKAVGAAHTDNELICGTGVALSNRFMNKIFDIEYFEGVPTVRAQPGVTIRQLGEWLHQRHKSLGFAVVGFEGVTLGGVIGTGAHGSAVHDTAILSDKVQSLRIVGSDGQVHEVTRAHTGQKNPELWRSLTLNLGMMGIISEIRLRIEEDFQLRVVSEKLNDDSLFVDGQGIWPYVSKCDTASFHWFPQRFNHKGRLIRNCGEVIKRGSQPWETFSKNVDKGAQYVLHAPSVPRVYYNFMKRLLHKGVCDPHEHFKIERIRRHDLPFHPPYAKQRAVLVKGLSPLTSHPSGITGWSFAMQNSVGSEEGNEYRQTDWEVAIPVKRSPEVFRFLRDFMNGETPSYEKAFPLQSVGFYIRFSKASSSLMSHAAIGGDFAPDDTVMFLELSEFLPYFDARNAREKIIADAIINEYERPFRIFITELINRFGARVHWAKNRQEFFALQQNNFERLRQISAFATHVNTFDPEGLFGNSLSEKLFATAQSMALR